MIPPIRQREQNGTAARHKNARTLFSLFPYLSPHLPGHGQADLVDRRLAAGEFAHDAFWKQTIDPVGHLGGSSSKSALMSRMPTPRARGDHLVVDKAGRADVGATRRRCAMTRDGPLACSRANDFAGCRRIALRTLWLVEVARHQCVPSWTARRREWRAVQAQTMTVAEAANRPVSLRAIFRDRHIADQASAGCGPLGTWLTPCSMKPFGRRRRRGHPELDRAALGAMTPVMSWPAVWLLPSTP